MKEKSNSPIKVHFAFFTLVQTAVFHIKNRPEGNIKPTGVLVTSLEF